MTYRQTPGPLPGEQFIPMSSGEGLLILEEFCTRCARDRAMREGDPIEDCDEDEVCEIIAASFRGQAVEWRQMDNGEVKCLSFVMNGDPVPDPKCEHTADLFEKSE